MRVLLCIFIVFIAVTLSGCSSLVCRSLMGQWTTQPEPCYFAGVRADCGAIKESMDAKNDRPALESIYYALDMPFSFGADVVFVPYDVYADINSAHRAKVRASLELK